MVILQYVGHIIFIRPDDKEIDALIASLRMTGSVQEATSCVRHHGWRRFTWLSRSQQDPSTTSMTEIHVIISESTRSLDHLDGGWTQLSQLHLIQQQIIDSLESRKTTPRQRELQPCQRLRGTIGTLSCRRQLNFLEISTRADLSYAVRQWCTRFTTRPKESHAEAIKHMGRYLIGTCDKAIKLNPVCTPSTADTLTQILLKLGLSTSKSRTDYVIKCRV
jgi:hypothetical protein